MNEKSEIKRQFEMEFELHNDNNEFSLTSNSSEGIRRSQVKNYSTLTDTFSNLNLNIPKELGTCSNDLITKKFQASASEEKIRPKPVYCSLSSENVESIYNLKRAFKNPITGEVTKIGAERVLLQPSSGYKPDDRATGVHSIVRKIKTDASEDKYCKKRFELSKNVKPSPYVNRNPLTGDGIGQTINWISKSSSSMRSGTRVSQPPGGRSSNIF